MHRQDYPRTAWPTSLYFEVNRFSLHLHPTQGNTLAKQHYALAWLQAVLRMGAFCAIRCRR